MVRNKEYRKKELRLKGLLLFLLYMGVLVYFLFFADWYGHVPGKGSEYSLNLVPFFEIRRFIRARKQLGYAAVFLNLLGNVIGFLPFGFFLPVISRKLHNIFLVTAFGCVVSTCVEHTQYILRDGCCDVDDVILNTLGAFLGYIIFVCLNALRRKIYDE
jgi:glycopeptide antibiotics resistance protein